MIDYAPMPIAVELPPVRRRNGVLVAQLVTMGVLFVAAALFATLYVSADRDRDAAENRLAQRRTELVEVERQAVEVGAERTDLDRRNTELADENAALQPCVDAVQHYLWDYLTDAESSTALQRMFDVCQ